MRSLVPRTAFVTILTAAAFAASGRAEDAPDKNPATVKLSADGESLHSIVLAPQADARTVELAGDLAAGLKRITGATFEVRRGEDRRGIVFGTDRDWPGIVPAPAADLSPLLTRENYVLRTDPGFLAIVGREVIGLQDALWDFFHRVGFRQFFPGPAWEIWPREPSLSVALNVVESPDYYQRAYAFTGIAAPATMKRLGVMADAEGNKAYERYLADVGQWKVRNRLDGGFTLQSSHVYGAIVSRNPEHFAKYPQDIVPRENGETRKLDPSRPTVLEVAAQDALRQLEADPALDSVSMEPSDGGGWRTDSPLGSPSNQAVTLANHVAKAIQQKFPGRKVGMNAYNEHSPPPTVGVDPNVIIMAATMFLRGGFTIDQVLEGWRARGADLGIREYHSYWSASHALPGRARADDLNYIARSIPHFHAKGAHYYKTEVSRTWFPHGLGLYVTARLLWKVSDAERLAEITDDFYTRAFGPIAPEMKQFHEQYLLAQGRPQLSEDLVGRMYRALQVALEKTRDAPEVGARLPDYVIYTRFLELTLAADGAEKETAEKALNELDRHIYRFRDSIAVNSGAYYRALSRSDRKAEQPAADWDRRLMSLDEAGTLIAQGIAANRVNSFESIRFSTDLVPWTGSNDKLAGGESVTLVKTAQLHLWSDKPGAFTVEVEGNQIYANRGPVKMRLFADANPLVGEPVAVSEAPADKTPHTISLRSEFAGLHRLEVSDGGAATKVSWPAGQRVVIPVTPEAVTGVVRSYKYDGVFYVPKGTKVIGGYIANATGKIFLPDGDEALDFKTMSRNSYFAIPVPPSSDGACWQVNGAMRGFLLLTVPPYLARSPAELLVPAEIVKEN